MVEKKVIHRLADGITGLEKNLHTGETRWFRFCKASEIHWEDVDKAKFGCNVADPSGIMAGVRWVPCQCEAVGADPNERIAAEEKWMKTLCHQHYLESQSLLRRIRLAAEQSKLELEIAQAKTNHDAVKSWASYPEHATLTIGEKKVPTPTVRNPNKTMSLDELLSSEALKQLNEFGYVQFKLADNYSDSSSVGWISRKTKTTVEKENVVISQNVR